MECENIKCNRHIDDPQSAYTCDSCGLMICRDCLGVIEKGKAICRYCYADRRAEKSC